MPKVRICTVQRFGLRHGTATAAAVTAAQQRGGGGGGSLATPRWRQRGGVGSMAAGTAATAAAVWQRRQKHVGGGVSAAVPQRQWQLGCGGGGSKALAGKFYYESCNRKDLKCVVCGPSSVVRGLCQLIPMYVHIIT